MSGHGSGQGCRVCGEDEAARLVLGIDGAESVALDLLRSADRIHAWRIDAEGASPPALGRDWLEQLSHLVLKDAAGGQAARRDDRREVRPRQLLLLDIYHRA